MKHPITVYIILFLATFSIEAQVSTKDIPYGLKSDLKLKKSLPQLKLGRIDIEQNLKEDSFAPIPLAYCKYVDTTLSIKEIGTKTSIESGDLWSYKIHTENAKSINLYLTYFEIPEGAKLFVYNEHEKEYLGAFTHINQKINKTLQIADLRGNELVIEYFEPNNSSFEGKIVVGSIGLGYRDIIEILSSDFIDVNCQDGNQWQLEKHAVCKITFRSGSDGYKCSGSLINTTANDGTPYFLTANHCISEEAEANTAILYFNYEKNECEGVTVVATNQTASGTQLIATSTQTDFTLLLLKETPPASYQPYYAGWSRDITGPDSAFSIHHPDGMVKKISFENDPVTSYPYEINWPRDGKIPPTKTPANSHWQVKFDKGITISGSSGGALFNTKGQIIGQLHGGDINGIDYYGKLSESWDLNLLNSRRLKPWLDPLNTNATAITGYIPDGVVPDAHFSTKLNTVCINHPIEFQNYSVLNAESYNWIIDPPYAEFVNGTNSTSANPVIQFDSPATYTITLQAQNGFGINQQVSNNYIEAGNSIATSYKTEKNSYCFYEFNDILIEPFGADNFYWQTNEIDEYITSTIDENDNIYLTLNNEIDSTYIAKIMLIGEQGTCTDTSEIHLNIIYTSNDDVQNSIPLEYGENGPFYNECATIQAYEPSPPVGSNCAGKDFWCDDYGNGTLIIENTTWFSFVAPQSGSVTIKVNGIDSQMAIYEADNADDIVSGNLNRYKLIAANDDYSATTTNAQIDSQALKPGKQYWIQIDGYQGVEGIYTIELIDDFQTGIIHETTDNPVKIYPIPSKDGIFEISLNDQYQKFQVNVYNLDGKLIHTEILYPGTRSLNLSKLSDGLYVVYILEENNIYQSKIIISR